MQPIGALTNAILLMHDGCVREPTHHTSFLRSRLVAIQSVSRQLRKQEARRYLQHLHRNVHSVSKSSLILNIVRFGIKGEGSILSSKQTWSQDSIMPLVTEDIYHVQGSPHIGGNI
jgi:hypothetical protein